MLCKNMLVLTCNALSRYFERSQIHLSTGRHLFFSECDDSEIGSFSSWNSKLAVHVYSLDHLYLLCSTCGKMHSSVVTLSPRDPYTHRDIHFSNYKAKFFVTTPIPARVVKAFLKHARPLTFFVLDLLLFSNATYLLEIFTNSITPLH